MKMSSLGLNVRTSLIFSTMLSVLLFCLMQMQKQWFASSQLHTIFGGYLGSVLFTFLLTAVGNMEYILFGPRFHTKLFPEVTLCLILSVMAAGMVHRVCSTTCFLFSMVGLYYINKASKQAFPASAPVTTVSSKKKK